MSETSVVVIGVFDGVHKGHQVLLNRAKEIADGRNIVALTFDPHPTTVFAPDKAPTMLTTLADRVELLKIHNADQVAVMKFNEKFAAMSPEDFVQTVLVNQLHAGTVIVGKNFTYGHKAAGNVDSLIKSGLTHNFTVDIQDLKTDEEVISSSRIRALVVEGKVEKARELLSRPHRLDGVVVHGEKRGREIGYPTANLGGWVDGHHQLQRSTHLGYEHFVSSYHQPYQSKKSQKPIDRIQLESNNLGNFDGACLLSGRWLTHHLVWQSDPYQ